jgi:hypothetical protein
LVTIENKLLNFLPYPPEISVNIKTTRNIPFFLFIAEAGENRHEGAQPWQQPALPPVKVSMQLKH